MFKYWHHLLNSITALFVKNRRINGAIGVISHEWLLIVTAAVLFILTLAIYGLNLKMDSTTYSCSCRVIPG